MIESALALAGFSAIGPVAGTLASGWMSAIATSKVVAVSTGWMYPALQSAAMGGAALCAIPSGTAVLGVATVGVVAAGVYNHGLSK